MTVFDVFGDVKKQISTSAKRKASISSVVFKTMKMAMLMTLMACVLVTAKQYIGDNINCVTGLTAQEHQAVETYCFISGTFTLIDLQQMETPHPGVGPSSGKKDSGDSSTSEVTVHAYYQWVPIVLALQVGIYYLPGMLWKGIDKGYFASSLCQLDIFHIEQPFVQKNVAASVSFFKQKMKKNNRYALGFLFNEIVAFSLAVGNLFFTNTFLGGKFFSFGPSAFRYLNSNITDPNNPLNVVFPKVAKCTWYRYGSSGTIQQEDSLCVLPLNIVNEKTYLFLWFVYLITAIITGVFLLYHIILFLFPGVRTSLLLKESRSLTTDDKEHLRHILRRGSFGDWFIIWNYRYKMFYYRDWVRWSYESDKKTVAQ